MLSGVIVCELLEKVVIMKFVVVMVLFVVLFVFIVDDFLLLSSLELEGLGFFLWLVFVKNVVRYSEGRLERYVVLRKFGYGFDFLGV